VTIRGCFPFFFSFFFIFFLFFLADIHPVAVYIDSNRVNVTMSGVFSFLSLFFVAQI
jgi:hypothetical protein